MALRSLASGLGASLFLLGLVGCGTAPQAPVPWAAASAQGGQRIGIAMTTLPKVDTEFSGAGCLLCMAAASLANSGLTAHAHTLTADELPQLKGMVAERLRKNGSTVVVIGDEVKLGELPKASATGTNVARQDFTVLRSRHGVDKLLVIQIDRLGFDRSYSAYFPTSDPKAVLRGAAYLVDLKSNTYEWYRPVNVVRGADGSWDEPGKYPGLTNAYFQVVELGKDEVLTPFQP